MDEIPVLIWRRFSFDILSHMTLVHMKAMLNSFQRTECDLESADNIALLSNNTHAA